MAARLLLGAMDRGMVSSSAAGVPLEPLLGPPAAFGGVAPLNGPELILLTPRVPPGGSVIHETSVRFPDITA